MYNLTEPAELVSYNVYMISFIVCIALILYFRMKLMRRVVLQFTFSFISPIIHIHFAISHIDFYPYFGFYVHHIYVLLPRFASSECFRFYECVVVPLLRVY